jgi:hypothetical protein
MKNHWRPFQTIAAAGLCALAFLAGPSPVAAEDATKPNYNYRPKSTEGVENDYHANYHADYSANRTQESTQDQRGDGRDRDLRRNDSRDSRAFNGGPFTGPGWNGRR